MDINDLMPQGFDAANQPDAPPPEKKPPMPPGCPGNCMITPEPVFQANKKATGYLFKVEMIVLGGPYAGRKLWHYFNMSNPDPLCVKISKAQLKKLCLSAGISSLNSKAELTGKIVRPTIKVDGIYNVVTDYAVADMAELAAAQQAAVDAANAPAAAPAGAAPVPFEGAADPTPADYAAAIQPPAPGNPVAVQSPVTPTAANPFPQQQQ